MGLFDDHLAFTTPTGPSALPPTGTHLLVTDALTASANVVLYHLFTSASAARVPIIWVDFRHETLASFDTVLRRLGSPLKRVTYIAPSPLPPSLQPSSTSSSPQPALFDEEPTMAPTVAAVRTALQSSPKALVVLDGLSELFDMGFNPICITQAVRALLSDARAAGGCVVSTAHENEELARRLLRLGPWWRVSGLTPRSGEVSGEISAIRGGSGSTGPAVSRAKAVQFRLEPAAVRAFPKGTGRGYL